MTCNHNAGLCFALDTGFQFFGFLLGSGQTLFLDLFDAKGLLASQLTTSHSGGNSRGRNE
jgi:hypothetical protein